MWKSLGLVLCVCGRQIIITIGCELSGIYTMMAVLAEKYLATIIGIKIIIIADKSPDGV